VPTFGAAVAGDTPPDVVSLDLIYPPAFAAAHDLTDVTALTHKLPYFSTFNPAQIRLATYQGKLYGVPFSAGGSVLMYNKGLFRQAGLNPDDPPRTWSAIEKDARAITALGASIYGFSFPAGCSGCNACTLLPLIWASGGDVLTRNGRTATLASSPPVKGALTFYHRLWTERVIPPSVRTDDWTTGFMNGAVGIIEGSPNFFPSAISALGDSNFGVAYVPGMSGGWSSFIGTYDADAGGPPPRVMCQRRSLPVAGYEWLVHSLPVLSI
jgi:multiple sugar transport system substrate-binding protein